MGIGFCQQITPGNGINNEPLCFSLMAALNRRKQDTTASHRQCFNSGDYAMTTTLHLHLEASYLSHRTYYIVAFTL